jgi:transcriptional regulator with XRE-family HTH domain
MSEDDVRQGVIAERLNHLWDTCQPLGRPYTLKEVTDGINEEAGEQIISVQYLSQLRNGDRTEPAYSKLVAITRFFGVPAGYFSDDETFRRTDEELGLLMARDRPVGQLPGPDLRAHRPGPPQRRPGRWPTVRSQEPLRRQLTAPPAGT